VAVTSAAGLDGTPLPIRRTVEFLLRPE